MSEKLVLTRERTVNTYALLWHASNCVLQAGEKEIQGSSWQFVSSLVHRAFAFEAYMNHVGVALIGSSWDFYWRHGEKFRRLRETLRITFPPDDQRPLSTLRELITLRNTLAHGKTYTIGPVETLHEVTDDLDALVSERLLTAWEARIETADFARQAREDVEAIMKTLHDARPEPKEGFLSQGFGFHRATVDRKQ